MQRLLTFFFLLLLTAPAAHAQRPVKGSGTIVNQVRPMERFSAVSLDFVADVTITAGGSPGMEITTDDNILAHIGTRVRRGTLMVSQDEWISPSQKVRIVITTPTLATLETSGYSSVEVLGLEGPRFSIDAGVGKVTATGKVDRLRIRTKTGTIDASALEVMAAEVTIESTGTAIVNARDDIQTSLSDRGTVVYAGMPAQVPTDPQVIPVARHNVEPVPEPERVAFTLRNNRAGRSSLEVEGPEGARFGYGFSLLPYTGKDENWPVGTRVYRVSRLGSRTLLYTVSASDRGATVNLFER